MVVDHAAYRPVFTSVRVLAPSRFMSRPVMLHTQCATSPLNMVSCYKFNNSIHQYSWFNNKYPERRNKSHGSPWWSQGVWICSTNPYLLKSVRSVFRNDRLSRTISSSPRGPHSFSAFSAFSQTRCGLILL